MFASSVYDSEIAIASPLPPSLLRKALLIGSSEVLPGSCDTLDALGCGAGRSDLLDTFQVPQVGEVKGVTYERCAFGCIGSGKRTMLRCRVPRHDRHVRNEMHHSDETHQTTLYDCIVQIVLKKFLLNKKGKYEVCQTYLFVKGFVFTSRKDREVESTA